MVENINRLTTQQQAYIPNEVKGLLILSLGDSYGKGEGKMNENEGYVHFAKIGIELFTESPESWGSYYRAWYNSPRKNITTPKTLWQSLSAFANTETNFRMSDVFVMSVLIGLAVSNENIALFIENILLSNDNLTAYRCARNQKIVLN